MFATLRRKLTELRTNTSGNATMLVALGLPVLMGGSGLAVDTAQWYMWRNELQFATDQAALAAAWARTSSDSTVQGTYKTRAGQEYAANLSMVGDFDTFDSSTNVTLAKYKGSSTDNSVIVTASATKALPFSSFMTGSQATVKVISQASFTVGTTYEACMLAVHPSADSAFKFGGSVGGTSTCGAGSLSNDSNAAMKEVGNTSVPLGKLIATGGIDQGFANNGTIYENQSGLSDPYASLEPPSASTSSNKEYSCPTPQEGGTTYTATYYTRTYNSYKYYKGSNSNSWTEQSPYTGDGYIADGYEDSSSSTKTVTSSAVTGWQTPSSTTTEGAVDIGGKGTKKMWRVKSYYTRDNYTKIDQRETLAVDGTARPEPGIYGSIEIQCKTEFSAGVYFISGGIDFGQNQTVTAAGTLFVMTGNSGSIKINSNSVLDLKGISATTLKDNYSYDPAAADKLAGMLFWDENSTSAFSMEGNASVKIDGTMYMPNRDATFNGNVNAATGGCMMVASRTLFISGNFNITNFCKPSGSSAMSLGGGAPTVKLVG